MGKVVDIESKPRRKARGAQKAVEDRSGPRRRRLHRRRLRDRRPARPRPARRQQHGQQLRRLRRHQRRLLRRRDARQRRHPRRDDAGAQLAGPSELEDLDLDKVLKPNYLGFLQKAAALPLRDRRAGRARWRGSASSRRSTSASVSPRRCPPASTRAPASATTSKGCSPTATGSTTSACSTASST